MSDTHFRFELDDAIGSVANRYTPDGPVQVWVLAYEWHDDITRHVGKRLQGDDGEWREMRMLMFPLGAPSYPAAELLAEHLRPVLERLNELAREDDLHHLLCTVADLLKAIDTVEKPKPDDGHRHEAIPERFSRDQAIVATCRLCLKRLAVLDSDEARRDPSREAQKTWLKRVEEEANQ